MTFLLNIWRFLPPRIWAVVAAVLLIGGLGLGWKCAHDRAEREAAAADRARAQAEAERDAAAIADDQASREAESRALDQTNRDEIMEADNADEDAGEAGRAGLRAICRRLPNHPDCRT